MTVERITVQAIRFVDENRRQRTLVPLLDDDGEFLVLDQDGLSYYANAGQIRDLIEVLRADYASHADVIADTLAAYEALAVLVEELAP